MPGLYAKGDFDLAGFSVGAVERDAILPKTKEMIAGDVLIGVASSGAHSNGYSLVRRVVQDAGDFVRCARAVRPAKKLGEALLAPTRLYVKSALAAIRAGGVKGFAHITGGGITENLPRALPEGLDADIDLSSMDIAAGVRVAGEVRRHRRARDAAHLQLRHRIGRRGVGEKRRPRHRRLPGIRRARLPHRRAGQGRRRSRKCAIAVR